MTHFAFQELRENWVMQEIKAILAEGTLPAELSVTHLAVTFTWKDAWAEARFMSMCAQQPMVHPDGERM